MSLIFTTITITTGNAILEYHFYGRLVIPAYNFLMFNVVESKSDKFGTEPGSYYIYEIV